MTEFSKFCIVGVAGFIVDAGILMLGTYAGFSPIIARIPAITAAITCTFLLNKIYSFQDKQDQLLKQFIQYISVSAVAASVNFVTFVLMHVFFGLSPLISLIIATILATGFNFFGYSKIVFMKPSKD